MFKIKYLPTGNVFVLPAGTAEELKLRAPDEYLILEKNGVKFRDKILIKNKSDNEKSILSRVLDKDTGKNRKRKKL